jgi:hypothetical protein
MVVVHGAIVDDRHKVLKFEGPVTILCAWHTHTKSLASLNVYKTGFQPCWILPVRQLCLAAASVTFSRWRAPESCRVTGHRPGDGASGGMH